MKSFENKVRDIIRTNKDIRIERFDFFKITVLTGVKIKPNTNQKYCEWVIKAIKLENNNNGSNNGEKFESYTLSTEENIDLSTDLQYYVETLLSVLLTLDHNKLNISDENNLNRIRLVPIHGLNTYLIWYAFHCYKCFYSLSMSILLQGIVNMNLLLTQGMMLRDTDGSCLQPFKYNQCAMVKHDKFKDTTIISVTKTLKFMANPNVKVYVHSEDKTSNNNTKDGDTNLAQFSDVITVREKLTKTEERKKNLIYIYRLFIYMVLPRR